MRLCISVCRNIKMTNKYLTENAIHEPNCVYFIYIQKEIGMIAVFNVVYIVFNLFSYYVCYVLKAENEIPDTYIDIVHLCVVI